MILKYFYFGWILYLQFEIIHCKSETERITYFDTERPVVSWFDKTVLNNFSMTSKRLNRQDPRHFLNLRIDLLATATNDVKVDFYFYQFLTNRYQPSFVEMHFNLCEMMQPDTIFGQPLLNAIGGKKCPYLPGIYELKNLTLPYVPKNFPFPKGRIYCNISLSENGVTRLKARGHIDFEIKTWHKILKTSRNTPV